MRSCLFCEIPATTTVSAARATYECFRCGKYSITSEAVVLLGGTTFSQEQQANISGYIRENEGVVFLMKDLELLKTLRTPTVAEKAMKGLLALAAHYPEPGRRVFFAWGLLEPAILHMKAEVADGREAVCDEQTKAVLHFQAICWARSELELQFLLDEHLKQQGFLQPLAAGTFKLSPHGWSTVDEWRRGTIQSDKAFVAMSFRPQFDEFYQKGLFQGISEAGYEPVRIDRVEHNNRIDDEIIASIRRCKFVVADFSLQRGGIYFEAGFAMGLGRRVIWTVREDRLHRVHFDTRQYNFIRWIPDDCPAFVKALRDRIEATLGKGPLSPA